MCETLEQAAEKVGDLLLATIFKADADEGRNRAIVFEFSGPDFIELVGARVGPMGVKLTKFDDKRSEFIRVAMVEDLLRTKMSIMVECALKRERYRKLKKEVDFVLHGIDWRAPDGKVENLTVRQILWKHSYGDEEKLAETSRVSDPPPLPGPEKSTVCCF